MRNLINLFVALPRVRFFLLVSKFYKLSDLTFDSSPGCEPSYRLQTGHGENIKFPSRQFLILPRLLPPGAFSFPYHYHLHSEELFIVVKGCATLRTPDGFQELPEGSVVFFEKGPAGAHQLRNEGAEPCIYLDFRTTPESDVCVYPDSGKVLLMPEGGIYLKNQSVGYFEGEESPLSHWERAKRHNKTGEKTAE